MKLIGSLTNNPQQNPFGKHRAVVVTNLNEIWWVYKLMYFKNNLPLSYLTKTGDLLYRRHYLRKTLRDIENELR